MAKHLFVYNKSYEDPIQAKEILSFEFDETIHTIPNNEEHDVESVYNLMLLTYDHTLLTRTAEIALFRKMNCAKFYKQIDIANECRNIILLHNMRLIPFTIDYHKITGIDAEIAVGEGSFILLKVINYFDVDALNKHGTVTKFSTYAVWSLYRELMRLKRDSEKTNSVLRNYDLDDVESISIDDYEVLSTVDQDRYDNVSAILTQLPECDIELLNKRFGLNGTKEHSLVALGLEYNCCYETIRKRQNRIIRQLRNKLQSTNEL